MKKIVLCLLTVLVTSLFIACGDDPEEEVRLLAVRIDEETLEASYPLEDFSVEDLDLVLTYEDGSTRTVSVTPSMLSATDLDALNKVGTHTVTIHYEAFSTMVVIHLVETPLFHQLTAIYDMGVAEGSITGSYEDWLESIRGEDGVGITDAHIDVTGRLILVFSDGTTRDVGEVVGRAGEDGREIVLRVREGVLEWKYAGETDYSPLIDFEQLTDTPVHTVSFVSDGGDALEARSVEHGTSLALPGTQREGYFFEGWYSDAFLTQPFDSSIPVYEDITLHAKWRWGGDYEIVDGEAIITGGSMYYWRHLVIPETLEGFPVRRIAPEAFKNHLTPQEVTLPEMLVEIGESAFERAYSLRFVHLEGDSRLQFIRSRAFAETPLNAFGWAPRLAHIGSEAFKNTGLTAFDFGPDVMRIEAGAFENCRSLREVVFPSRVETIFPRTFAGTTSLTSFVFPAHSRLETVLSDAFEKTGLRMLFLPEGVKSLEGLAFSFQYDAVLYLPNSVVDFGEYGVRSEDPETSLTLLAGAEAQPGTWHEDWNPQDHTVIWGYDKDADDAFETRTTLYEGEGAIVVTGYTGAATHLVFPTHIHGTPVIGIDEDAFRGNQTVETVILPPTLRWIDHRVFKDASNLQEVVLPEGLRSIGFDAFRNTALKTVRLPAALQHAVIAARAFEGIPRLTILSDSPEAGIDWMPGWHAEDAIIYWDARVTVSGLYYDIVTKGHESVAVITGLNATLKALRIPETIHGHPVVELADEAFMGETQLERIILPSTLSRIGVRALAQLDHVRSIVFEEHTALETIDTEAFKGASMLEAFLIPDSVTHVGARAFADCDTLELYAEAPQRPFTWNFHWNADGRPVTWGFNRYGSTEAFDYTLIGTFYGLGIRIDQYVGLETELVVPTQISGFDVTHIGDFAFMLAPPDLERVTLPASVVSIGEGAFSGAAMLEALDLRPGSRLAEIGAHAFSDAGSLRNFFIPMSVDTIGTHAFAGCHDLTIQAEANGPQSGWHEAWNPDGVKVEWGQSPPDLFP